MSKKISIIKSLLLIFVLVINLNLDSGLCGSKPDRKVHTEDKSRVCIRGVWFPGKDEEKRHTVFVNRTGINVKMTIKRQCPLTIPIIIRKGRQTRIKTVYKDEVVVFNWREVKGGREISNSAVLPGELIVCERIKLCWDCGNLDFKPDFNPKRVKVKPVVTTGAAAHGPMVTDFDKKEEDNSSSLELLEVSKKKLLINLVDSDSDLEGII